MEAEARDHLNGVFARRVRQRLVEIDHGPAWLANQLNKDPSTVAGWLRGEHLPRVAGLRDVALVLHRPVPWLLGETDNPHNLDDLNSN